MVYPVLRNHEIEVKSSERDDVNMSTVKSDVKDKETLCLRSIYSWVVGVLCTEHVRLSACWSQDGGGIYDVSKLAVRFVQWGNLQASTELLRHVLGV